MISRRSLIGAGAGIGAAGALMAGGAALPGRAPAFAAGAPWARLRERLTGELVLPADPSYTVAKQLQLAQYDTVEPQAVAYCASASDVTACVRFAQEHRIAVAARSGGHSFAGYSTTPGLVVDVSRLNSVRPGRSTVRLGPGGQGVDVVHALDRYGVQVAGGTCPTVAAGGWLLGGGLGPHARRFGMGCDRLVSAQVVLADGTLTRCSEREEPDLFWALRGGGGGNFGVVTEYEVRPTRLPSMVVFTLTFAWAAAAEVALAWQQWIATGPLELAAELSVTLTTDGPAGTEPEVRVSGTFAGAAAVCDRLLDQLVAAAGARPAVREATELPYRAGMMKIFGCADRSVPECHRTGYSPQARLPRDNYVTGRNLYFTRPWTAPAAKEALRAFEAALRPGQFRFLGLFAYGGRINDVDPKATAFVHRDALFEADYQVGLTTPLPEKEQREAARSWADGGYAAVLPWSNRRSYQNYMDPALRDWREAYYGQNYERLRAVKRAYDPYGFFRFAQGID
ncbi:FAD-binding oxidoreductase [Streptomyces albireticuli]|nr:FAD-binding oxidoreductase [Streptomyces albireticuli]MCD9143604.1 FAD-binding oxidoreductase [Streptomyces albireticuli]MCD9161965.1 FAD-binding oxidoreductase [Streptomyces albireticuli]MCD9191721.1 FAD-binding oxidoreductase [Streptomyces albireticuli]